MMVKLEPIPSGSGTGEGEQETDVIGLHRLALVSDLACCFLVCKKKITSVKMTDLSSGISAAI